jgi:UDPglucose 6-dehydrogenase
MCEQDEQRINKNVKMGVIGSLGTVGRTVKCTLRYYYKHVIGYDIKGEGTWKDILTSDILFICVPTKEKNGRLDCSTVDSILDKLSKTNYNGIIVIKDTVKIGYMDDAKEKFPKSRLVYMPEFFREKSAFPWFVCPDRLVISGGSEDVKKVLEIFSWVEDAKILVLDWKSAEVAKLANNAFIALKVSFTNEIERICNEVGADPFKVMKVIWLDRRVKSNDHLKPKLGPYGGKCVPKDTRELINATTKCIVLKAAEKLNNILIEEKEKIPRGKA